MAVSRGGRRRALRRLSEELGERRRNPPPDRREVDGTGLGKRANADDGHRET
jgi:hypothetical protein